jgi:thioredoxin reductase (NADPH)
VAEDLYDVAVIGGGGAGTMAFLRAVLNFDRSVLFIGDANDKRRGRATWVSDVDNIPGMHDLQRPITSTTTSTLKWIAGQENLRDVGTTLKASVTNVRKADEHFVVTYETKSDTKEIAARFVILATGLMDRQPEIDGSIETLFPYANRGDLLYCLRCDGHRTIGHSLSVIGHGDTGVAIAAMMHERYGHENIAIISNGESFTALSDQSKQLIEAYGFELHDQALAEVLGEPKGKGLSGFRLEDGTVVETTRCIVALGTIVYSTLLTDLGGAVDGDGRVIVGEAYETSVPGFFAVGDLVAGRKLQIYTAWDEAVDAADEINRRLRKAKRRVALAQKQHS